MTSVGRKRSPAEDNEDQGAAKVPLKDEVMNPLYDDQEDEDGEEQEDQEEEEEEEQDIKLFLNLGSGDEEDETKDIKNRLDF